MIEEVVKFWDLVPRMDLLETDEENQAYIAAKEGEYYLVYFTGPWKCRLDLRKNDEVFELRWINYETAEWGEEKELQGGGIAELESGPDSGNIAVLKLKSN